MNRSSDIEVNKFRQLVQLKCLVDKHLGLERVLSKLNLLLALLGCHMPINFICSTICLGLTEYKSKFM